MFGTIQFGHVLHTQQLMVNAAREAARSFAVGASNSAQAQQLARGLLASTTLVYTVTVTQAPSAGGNDVTVQITTPMAAAALVNVLDVVFAGNIQASVTMRVES